MKDKFLKVMLVSLSFIGFILIGFSLYFWFVPTDFHDIIFRINLLTLSMGILYLSFIFFVWNIYFK